MPNAEPDLLDSIRESITETVLRSDLDPVPRGTAANEVMWQDSNRGKEWLRDEVKEALKIVRREFKKAWPHGWSAK